MQECMLQCICFLGGFGDHFDGGYSLVRDALVAYPFGRVFTRKKIVGHPAHPGALPMVPALTPTLTVYGLVVVLDILTTPSTRVLLTRHTPTWCLITRRFCFTLDGGTYYLQVLHTRSRHSPLTWGLSQCNINTLCDVTTGKVRFILKTKKIYTNHAA